VRAMLKEARISERVVRTQGVAQLLRFVSHTLVRVRDNCLHLWPRTNRRRPCQSSRLASAAPPRDS
jgi:hypothetical protein